MDMEPTDSLYRHMFAAATDAMLVIKDDIIVDCNRSACEMLRMSREQIIGRHACLC